MNIHKVNNALMMIALLTLQSTCSEMVSLQTDLYVVYDGNGATSGHAPVDRARYVEGAEVVVLEPYSIDRIGHIFTGWNTEPDGSGDTYIPGSTFTILSETTIYAEWVLVFRVIYDGNGYDEGIVPVDILPYQTSNMATILSQGNLSKNGYAFGGWNSAADGTGTSYAAGDALTIGSTSMVLFAQWTAPQTGSISGTIYFEGTRYPLPGAHVSVGEAQTVTAIDGTFALQTVELGVQLFKVQRTGFLPYLSDIDLQNSGSYEINMLYAMGETITGAVELPNGQTWMTSGVILLNPDESDSAYAYTVASDGSYRLPLIPQNQVIICVRKVGYTEHRFVFQTDESGFEAVLSLEWVIGGVGPAGGGVFHDKGYYSDGWRYLEAAPATTEWDVEWGPVGIDIAGASGTAIGTGAQNTADIVAAQGTGSATAGQLCDGMSYGGYDDWFLPSRDELNLMYINLHGNGLGGYALDVYWSSTETNSDLAYRQSFPSGSQVGSPKSTVDRVRAARAF